MPEVTIDSREDGYWIVATMPSGFSGEIGPFETVAEAGRAANDAQAMLNSTVQN